MFSRKALLAMREIIRKEANRFHPHGINPKYQDALDRLASALEGVASFLYDKSTDTTGVR